MLLLLLRLSLAEESCVAPLVTPPPVPNKELKLVQIMVRHGARSPLAAYLPYMARGYWLCDGDDSYSPRMHAGPSNQFRRFKQVLDPRIADYPPNCKLGDLTTVGMEQHHKLGELYHRYLFAQHRLFHELPVPSDEIRVRCTDIERTFRSAESFLHGAFPPQGPGEVIDVLADTEDGGTLKMEFEWFKDARDVRDRWFASDEFKKWLDEEWEIVKDVAIELGVGEKSQANLNSVCDFISTHYCSGKSLPSFVTDDVQKTCTGVLGNMTWNMLETNRTVIGSFMVREIMKVPLAMVNGTSKVKFTLLSSHDTALAAVLVFLQGRMGRVMVPGFASHLVMELWKADDDQDYTIRWALNGEPIPLREMGNNTTVFFNEFLEAYSDMNKYCLEIW